MRTFHLSLFPTSCLYFRANSWSLMKNAQASLENWLQLKEVMQPVSEWLKGVFNELRKRRSALWALMCWILLSKWKRRCCQTSVCLSVAEDERRKSEWLRACAEKHVSLLQQQQSCSAERPLLIRLPVTYQFDPGPTQGSSVAAMNVCVSVCVRRIRCQG